MEEFILQLVIGIIFSFTHITIWSFEIDKKINFLNIKTILLILLLSNIMAINYLYMNNYLKIIIITVIMMGFCKILFKKSWEESIIAPIVSQLLMILVEFVFVFVFLNIVNLNDYVVFNNYVGTLLPNIVIAVCVLILVKLKLARKLYLIFKKITSKIKKYELILFILLLIVTINLIEVKIYYNVNIRKLIITNVVLMIIYAFIIFKMANTKNKYLVISNRYNNSKKSLSEYQAVINRYRIDNHENKNQLRRLKGKIDPNNEEALNYVDNILNARIKPNEKILNKTKIIPECDLRTLIDAKIMTMEEKQIKNTIHVDKQIKTTDFIEMDNNLVEDICKIVGVYLDNAIEAVENLNKKEVQLDLYNIDGYMHISVVNNYEGHIDLDKLNNVGYTTKSNGHGYGLALVNEIVENNKVLSKETHVDQHIFKQVLKIKM